jgi:hypothetical protein
VGGGERDPEVLPQEKEKDKELHVSSLERPSRAERIGAVRVGRDRPLKGNLRQRRN